MAKDLKLNLVVNKSTGATAAFSQLEKGLKALAKHAQESAVALAQMGNKQAATAMGHMALAVRQSTDAFKENGKELKTHADKIANSTKGMSTYEKELLASTGTIGNHNKAVKALGKEYQTTEASTKNWLPVLKKVEAAGMQMVQQFKGQRVELVGAKPYVAGYIKSLDTAAISQQVLSGNIKVTNSGFKILNKDGLAAFTNLTQKSAEKLGMLDKSFGKVKASVADTTAWKKAKSNYEGNSRALTRLNALVAKNPKLTKWAADALNRLNKRLKESQVSTSKLGAGMDFLGKKFKSFAAYTIAAATTAATLGTAFKLFTTNIEYSQALKDVQAITSATTQELAMMDTKIREVAGSTKFSASEIAEGMKMLGQTGFSAQESIQAIEAISNLATGTLSSMSTSVEIVTTALRVFQKDASEAAHVSDVFTNAVNNSKLTIEKIKTAFNYLGPLARNAGMALEDTTSVLMVLANAGVRASSSATGFRRVLQQLIQPSQDMKDAILGAGYAIEDFDIQSNDMGDVIGRLGDIVGNSGDALKLFGLRGSTVASALVTQGVPAFEKMRNAVDRQGTAAKNAAIQVEGLGIKYKQIKDKASNLALAVGDAGLNGVLHVFADVVRAGIDAVTAFVSLPVIKYVVGISAAFLTLIGLQVGTHMLATTAVFGKLALKIKNATAATKLFNLTMLKNPYVIAAAALIALGVAVYKYNKSVDDQIAKQKTLQAASLKNVQTLESEIAAVANFNGTANDKLGMLDKLAKSYPQYAAEIYTTKGKAEELLTVLKEIQKVENQKTYDAAKKELEAYAKKLKTVVNSLEKAQRAKEAQFHSDETNTKNLAALNKAQMDYNALIADSTEKVKFLNEAGIAYDMEDLFPQDAYGNIKKRYQGYYDSIKKTEDARSALIAMEESGVADAKKVQTEISIQKEKIKTARIEEEAAIGARAAATERKMAADYYLAKLEKQGASFKEITLAKKEVAAADAELEKSSETVLRLGRKILIQEGQLVPLVLEKAELEEKIAKFYGGDRAKALAKENVEHHKQLEILKDITEARLAGGMGSAEATALLYKEQEIELKRHNEREAAIKSEYTIRNIDLVKRAEEAMQDLSYDTFEKRKKSEIALLESQKMQDEKQISEKKITLGVLLKEETLNNDEIFRLTNEIKDQKKDVYTAEEKLIKLRTKLVQDSYNKELELINRNAGIALAGLEKRHSLGLIETEQYESAKRDIVAVSLAERYTKAFSHATALSKVENVKKDDVLKANQTIENLHIEFYNAELDRAGRIRKQKQIDAAEEEAETKKKMADDEKRTQGAMGQMERIHGLYMKITNDMLDVGTKAAAMIAGNNEIMLGGVRAAQDMTDEVSNWSTKLKESQDFLVRIEEKIWETMGTWSTMYMDMYDKYKKVVEATKEKLKYEIDINRLTNTEITDTTDLIQVQRKLNDVRTTYMYLGEEDLENLFAAKRSIQEQINAQRLLNAERDNVDIAGIQARLEEAQAAGQDISEYGFDQGSVDRLAAIEKQTKEVEAQIATQEYADALYLQTLIQRGALEEEIALFREEAEARITELRNPLELVELEKSALTSKLDLERLNLEVINDLKIIQFEEELAREELLHQTKLENIELENARLLELLAEQEASVSTESAGLDRGLLPGLTPIKKAAGGKIPGESTIDSVKVLARPGEWFIRNESAGHWTKQFGEGFMNGINKPLSAAGRGISAALGKASSIPMPSVVQAPKVTFATGGQVSSRKDEDTVTVLEKIASALSRQSTNTTSDEQAPAKQFTIKLDSGKSQATGQFSENEAKKLFQILQDQQMVAG